MNNNKKKRALLLTIASAVILLAGAVLTAIGYITNSDGVIDKNDIVLFIGYFLVLIGTVFLVNALISLFSKKEQTELAGSEKIKRLAYAALFAALSYVAFQFFKIDIYVGPEKTALHLANTFVVLGALFLGGSWGGMAGAVGLTIADLTSGYVTSAPKTFLLKLLIGLIAGFVAHKLFHISKQAKPGKILLATIVSAAAGLLFNVVADPLVGYLYKKYLFGLPQDIASALAKMSSVATAINAAFSIACVILIYSAVRPALIKAGLFLRLEKEDKA